jgi:hypothetical protein
MHTATTSKPLVVRQVSLGPVWTGSGSGLREGVAALPRSVTSLALSPHISRAEREEGVSGGAWRLRLGSVPLGGGWRSVPGVLELCAVFDRPGMPCGLEGRVELSITPPTEAGPGALDAYLAQCLELTGRLRSGGTPRGVKLALGVGGPAGGGGAGGGGLLGHLLGAMLPAAAPHLTGLRLVAPRAFPPGFSRHLTTAFPLLCSLELDNKYWGTSMDAADVEALARLAAPRLCRVGLLCRAFDVEEDPGGAITGGSTTRAVTALAMSLPRPVDATGRLAGLQLFVGAHPSEEGDEEGLKRALNGARRGWVHVKWPPYYTLRI